MISFSPAIPGISLGAGQTEQPKADGEERRGAECVCDCDWHALRIGPAVRAVVTAGRRLVVRVAALCVALRRGEAEARDERIPRRLGLHLGRVVRAEVTE